MKGHLGYAIHKLKQATHALELYVEDPNGLRAEGTRKVDLFGQPLKPVYPKNRLEDEELLRRTHPETARVVQKSKGPQAPYFGPERRIHHTSTMGRHPYVPLSELEIKGKSAGTDVHCVCGGQPLHKQYCPMWEDPYAPKDNPPEKLVMDPTPGPSRMPEAEAPFAGYDDSNWPNSPIRKPSPNDPPPTVPAHHGIAGPDGICRCGRQGIWTRGYDDPDSVYQHSDGSGFTSACNEKSKGTRTPEFKHVTQETILRKVAELNRPQVEDAQDHRDPITSGPQVEDTHLVQTLPPHVEERVPSFSSASERGSKPPMCERINWIEFHTYCKRMADYLKPKENGNKIFIAVTRDGLFPAGILSHALDHRLVDTICVSSWNDQGVQGPIRVLKKPSEYWPLMPNGSNLVFIDAISDTGRTADAIRTLYPSCTYIVMVAKKKGIASVDYYAQMVSDSWILFPWDDDPTS